MKNQLSPPPKGKKETINMTGGRKMSTLQGNGLPESPNKRESNNSVMSMSQIANDRLS